MNAKNRFYSRKWGVFNHYICGLQNNPESEHSYYKQLPWDEHVKAFDTELVAKTLHEMGAGYYLPRDDGGADSRDYRGLRQDCKALYGCRG